MTIDRYTKAVLTVIAGCLLWQCVMTTPRPVSAQQLAPVPAGLLAERAQPVVIVGWGEMTTAGHITLNTKRLPNGIIASDPTLPVRLPYTDRNPLSVVVTNQQPIPVDARDVRLAYTPDSPLPVGITLVRKTTDQWDPINTQVMRQSPTRMPGQ